MSNNLRRLNLFIVVFSLTTIYLNNFLFIKPNESSASFYPITSEIQIAPKLDTKVGLEVIKEPIKPIEIVQRPKTPQIKTMPVNVDLGMIKQYTKEVAARDYGWTGEYWLALDYIIDAESDYKPYAQNPRSTAYGIYQFLDSTWTSYGCVKTSDYKEQTRCGLLRIKKRYGSPIEAKKFHLKNNWY